MLINRPGQYPTKSNKRTFSEIEANIKNYLCTHIGTHIITPLKEVLWNPHPLGASEPT